MQATTDFQGDKGATPQKRALRLESVLNKVGISRTQLYRLINQGRFPRQFHLSPRTAVWDETEIDTWLNAKREER